MIIINDATNKPVTPLEAMKWHGQEIKIVNKLAKDSSLSVVARKEFREYKNRLTTSQGRVIMAINRSIK
jgi:hypothetical protein